MYVWEAQSDGVMSAYPASVTARPYPQQAPQVHSPPPLSPHLNTVQCPHCTLLLSFPPGTQLLICPACNRTSALTVVPRLQMRCYQCHSVLHYLPHYAVVQCPKCAAQMHTPTNANTAAPMPRQSLPVSPIAAAPTQLPSPPLRKAPTISAPPAAAAAAAAVSTGDFSSAEHKREFTAADDAAAAVSTSAHDTNAAPKPTTFTRANDPPSQSSSLWSSLAGSTRRRPIKDADGNQWQPLEEDSNSAYHQYNQL